MLKILKYENILAFLAIATFVFGIIGFSFSKESTGLEILNHTLGLYVMEWIDHDDSWILDFATLFGALTFFLTIIKLFFSKLFQKWRHYSIQNSSYTIVLGLSEQNISLLKSNDRYLSTVIIEKDKNHPHIISFRNKGFLVIEGHTKEAIANLDLTYMERCFISTGNDRKNIALGKFIMNRITDIHRHCIHICIGNRDLNVLFKHDVITPDERKEVRISTYSLYENMVKSLFLEHSILGEQFGIIKTTDDFSMVIVGDSDLAVELVYHIAFLSTLPNQNTLTLYLLGANAIEFHDRVKKIFPKIDMISHLKIKAKELRSESLEFYEYKNGIWESRNLTNIFIATRDEEKNLEIAINLQDTTFVKEIGHKRFKSKVLFALYHNLGLGEEIDNNSEDFTNFHTFGNIFKNSTKEILIDEKLDRVAKLIQNDYRGEKDIITTELDRAWMNTSTHEQESNKTQALHLDIKLLAFGLKREASTKSLDELLQINSRIFYAIIKESDRIKAQLNNYNNDYFPSSFDNELLDQVARSEHNRWSAFQHLNGWEYSKIRNNNAKEHNCLKPLEEFEDEIQYTYQYDLASVYFIPVYLARAGFEVLRTDL